MAEKKIPQPETPAAATRARGTVTDEAVLAKTGHSLADALRDHLHGE